MHPRAYVLCLIACVAALALIACSSGDDDDAGSTPTNAAPSISGPQAQPFPLQPLAAEQTQPQGGAIEIAATGSQFTQNNLAVPVGESVIIRVTNNDAVSHNLRLAGIDGVFDTEDDAVSVPGEIAPGGVGELTFVPPADGYYTFRCDFHTADMNGEIVVE